MVAPALFFALVAGSILDDVKCDADPSQSYALYVPSTYSGDRAWPVILAFDPRARGRTPVERYEAAAEKYGYIVAGSNNSRNGSWQVSMKAAEAMAADVSRRFNIDTKRVYTAGMSGGARVAMGIALGGNSVAGVVASSAGYPDSKPRKTVPFVVFGTAGTDDFNHHEMRELDRALTSPHRVEIFDGGHVWLSSELAMQAVEWLELQAMVSNRTPRKSEWLDQLYVSRLADAEKLTGAAGVLALEGIAADFRAFRDVSAVASKAVAMRKQKPIRDEFKRQNEEDATEVRIFEDIFALERRLNDTEARPVALTQLRSEWTRLAAAANEANDSSKRRIARRLTRSLAMSVSERTSDGDYRKMVAELVPPSPRR